MFINKWNLDLMIGINDIDRCHKYLLGILNEAYNGFVIGINVDDSILGEVLSCMAECFDFEETLMLETSYPKFMEHKQEHEIFTLRLVDINNSHNQDASTSVELLILLNNWISNHIRNSDLQLGYFIQARELGKRDLAREAHQNQPGRDLRQLRPSTLS